MTFRLPIPLVFLILLLPALASSSSREPIGPSARTTGLVLSEIMYAPLAAGGDLEFVEIFNSNPWSIDISGYHLTDEIEYTFPEPQVIAARAFLVVARDPGNVRQYYGLTNVAGPFDGRLANEGGTVELRDRSGARLLQARYGSGSDWPLAADGCGHSLVLAHPSRGEANRAAWSFSVEVGGSPGRDEPAEFPPLRSLVINEFLAYVASPDLDFVELLNTSSNVLDISGCTLSDEWPTTKFIFPDGTVLPPGGFMALDEHIFTFALNSRGEEIYLRGPSGEMLDAVRFDDQALNISSGRFPDGTGTIVPLTEPTPFAASALPQPRRVIINEILSTGGTAPGAVEFIELHNPTDRLVDLSGARLSGAATFLFPAGHFIGPGQFCVLATDRTNLLSNYPQLAGTCTLGALATAFETTDRITLSGPVFVVTTNDLERTETNTFSLVMDEVVLPPAHQLTTLIGSWERANPGSAHGLGSEWAESHEAGKALWTTVASTSLSGTNEVSEMQLLLLGAGAALVRNVEVLSATGENLVRNFTLSPEGKGWHFEGNHSTSTYVTGSDGQGMLQLRAEGGGDTGPNQVQGQLTRSIQRGEPITLRAQVQWQSGDSRIVLRLPGGAVEAAGHLAVSTRPGTPGSTNTARAVAVKPRLALVQHEPILPKAFEPLAVTALVTGQEPGSVVECRSRVDPESDLSLAVMRDDGTGGDLIAGDHVFTALVSGRPEGTLLAYHIALRDSSGNGVATTYPAAFPKTECLVRWGETSRITPFAEYRLWITQENLNRWQNANPLSDVAVEATFIYANTRVIHDARVRYAGDLTARARYDSPSGVPCDYMISLPSGETVLGASEFYLQAVAASEDPTGQRALLAMWGGDRLGLPTTHQRLVQFSLNGLSSTERDIIGYLDREQIDAAYFARRSGNVRGDFYEAHLWFEVDNNSRLHFVSDAQLDLLSVDAGSTISGWNWNWRQRPGGSWMGYEPLHGLSEAMRFPSTSSLTRLSSWMDVDQWMGVIAWRHAVGERNGYGSTSGTHTLLRLSPGDLARLYPFDFAHAWGGSEGGPGDDVFATSDALLAGLWNDPGLSRSYLWSLQRWLEGPLSSAMVEPVLQERYDAMRTNGLPVTSPFVPSGLAGISISDWITQQRNSLEPLFIDSPFSIENPDPIITVTNGNVAIFRGRAPLSLGGISVNSVAHPLEWTSAWEWTLRLPLTALTTIAALSPEDHQGLPLGGGYEFEIELASEVPGPEKLLVMNEVMYRPAVAGASYLELYNRSSNMLLSLEGYSVQPLGFTFPTGAQIPPGGFVVLARNRARFTATYGYNPNLMGEYPFDLPLQDGLLVLANQNGETVTQLHYDSMVPWPSSANGTGASLQLNDSDQDPGRVANWSIQAYQPTRPESTVLATPGTTNQHPGALVQFAPLWLNEALPSNTNGLMDQAGDHDPWVEIHNSSDTAVALDHYYLGDTNNFARWRFPAGAEIPAYAYLVIWCDGEAAENRPNELHANFRLNASSGMVLLTEQGANEIFVVDYLAYDELPAGSSFGAYPNGQGAYRAIQDQPTPGDQNVPPHVRINEWMASNQEIVADPADGDFEDWIELYNGNPFPINLSGHWFSDSLIPKWQIPAGTTIPGGGYLIIWADDEVRQNKPGGDLHAPFKLSASGENLSLWTTDQQFQLDAVEFGGQTTDISEGRFPDGGEQIGFPSQPTPRGPNRSLNTPPRILIAEQFTVSAGDQLRVFIPVLDEDLPPQQLNFFLISGPPNAQLDTASGLLVWHPAAPGDYPFDIEVRDNGRPNLSSSFRFRILVTSPRFTSIVVSPSAIMLTCETIPGVPYRIEYTDNLDEQNWRPLLNWTAAQSFTVIEDLGLGQDQRFYRLLRVNP